ncbi:MAG: hypothetical protein PVJ73_06025 [Acidobacteriota bacterium]
MNRVLLTSVVTTLMAGLLLAQPGMAGVQERPPIARITGGHALVEENGRFEQTWVHPDESLRRFDKVFLWNVAFQFRDVGKKKTRGTSSSILATTGGEAYPVPKVEKKKFMHIVGDAFGEELKRSESFQMVDEVVPGTLVVRGAVMDITSWVPPSTARVDVYLAEVGEGVVLFELIDPETGLMQARVGERSNIRPPDHVDSAFNRPANFNTVWPDIDRWAHGVASELRLELETRLKKPEED